MLTSKNTSKHPQIVGEGNENEKEKENSDIAAKFCYGIDHGDDSFCGGGSRCGAEHTCIIGYGKLRKWFITDSTAEVHHYGTG